MSYTNVSYEGLYEQHPSLNDQDGFRESDSSSSGSDSDKKEVCDILQKPGRHCYQKCYKSIPILWKRHRCVIVSACVLILYLRNKDQFENWVYTHYWSYTCDPQFCNYDIDAEGWCPQTWSCYQTTFDGYWCWDIKNQVTNPSPNGSHGLITLECEQHFPWFNFWKSCLVPSFCHCDTDYYKSPKKNDGDWNTEFQAKVKDIVNYNRECNNTETK